MTLQTDFPHVCFIEMENTTGREMTRWSCDTPDGSFSFGIVQWDSFWKQYLFFPIGIRVFVYDCLAEIADFLKQLNDEHEKSISERKRDLYNNTQ